MKRVKRIADFKRDLSVMCLACLELSDCGFNKSTVRTYKKRLRENKNISFESKLQILASIGFFLSVPKPFQNKKVYEAMEVINNHLLVKK